MSEGTPDSESRSNPDSLLRGRTLRLFLTVAALAAVAWTGNYAWRTWCKPSTQEPQDFVSADNIHTPPLPPWIRANVVEEAIQSGSLQTQSLLDPQLTIKVADAFRLHPWVRSVRRVSKRRPAVVEVDLEYRHPAALVEVTTPSARGVLPVDADGVLLPREDFIDEQGRLLETALKYPVIVAGDALPEGAAGAAWGNKTVAGGARLAAAFGESWSQCGLFKIVPEAANSETSSGEIALVLLARNGSRILWGAAPGNQAQDQAETKEKVEKLCQFIAVNKPFAADESLVEIDFRTDADPVVAPYTARLPE